MTSSDRFADSSARQPRRAMRLALAVLATVCAWVVLLVAPPPPQASHETDGEVLAWVESYDAFDASAGLVDAAVADRPSGLGALASLSGGTVALPAGGACQARQAVGFPALGTSGAELPKAGGDLPELEPARAFGASGTPVRPRALASDPAPPRAALQPPLRPPRA